MKKTEEQWELDLIAYRKKHFAVKVEQSQWDGVQILLCVTHNGSQWQTVLFLPDEARAVIEALKKYLYENQL